MLTRRSRQHNTFSTVHFLDLGVFGPFKYHLNQAITTFSRSNIENEISMSISRSKMMELATSSYDRATSPHIIKQGFAASGISPFNPSRVLEKLSTGASDATNSMEHHPTRKLKRLFPLPKIPVKKSEKKHPILIKKVYVLTEGKVIVAIKEKEALQEEKKRKKKKEKKKWERKIVTKHLQLII